MEAQINQSTQQQRKTTGATDDLPAVPALPTVRFGETPAVVNQGADTKIDVCHVNFYYGEKQALYDITLPIRERQVTALIGPSGCGKSTFLRTLNRMNDLIPKTRTTGEAMMNGIDIYDSTTDVVALRQRVGMVFQRPNPFPKSIFHNLPSALPIPAQPA